MNIIHYILIIFFLTFACFSLPQVIAVYKECNGGIIKGYNTKYPLAMVICVETK